MSDINTDALVQSLSIGQSAPGIVTIGLTATQSLSIGHRFHRARLRVRNTTGAVVQSISIGQVASIGGPGATPTR